MDPKKQYLSLFATAASFYLLVMPYMVFGAVEVLSKDVGIQNPLKVTTLTELVDLVINGLLAIGIPIIALMIMWVGFKFVSAGGDQKQIDDAKGMLKWTLIGTAIVLGAKGILELIQGTISQVVK